MIAQLLHFSSIMHCLCVCVEAGENEPSEVADLRKPSTKQTYTYHIKHENPKSKDSTGLYS